MKTVFADTYYFLAMANDQDEGHERAHRFARSFSGRIVTTEWVLTEVGDAFAKPGWRPSFIATLAKVRNDPHVAIIEASHDLFERAARLFANRPDKEWSVTDCTSFVVMKERGLDEAITDDHHFRQAGFATLLSGDAMSD